VRKADNLPPSYADVKKSGGLNLLESCGPVQACNGTALSLAIIIIIVISSSSSSSSSNRSRSSSSSIVVKHKVPELLQKISKEMPPG
jgi:hypothetical protein